MATRSGATVLLFFSDIERDSYVRGDRYIKRMVRPLLYRALHRPQVSGFVMWFQRLVRALEHRGHDVRVNDIAYASQHPDHPVGLVGYPHLLDDWKLPNPAVLGPALFDHPNAAPSLMDDRRFIRYLVTCGWMEELFVPVYGREQVGTWYAGIDLDAWPDMLRQPKRFDVLVYDKIRWDHEARQADLLDPILDHLRQRGLAYTLVRYGRYDHAAYRRSLAQSRSMLFLCEHETQGMAYQEALATNTPVIAWDNGYWLDPNRPKYQDSPVRATSVPYFSSECGERFTDLDDFYGQFDRFWASLDSYCPREWVRRNLSLEGSADLYMTHYGNPAGD